MTPTADSGARKPLSDCPNHLRLLADWLDLKYPNDANPQAQDDLRYWANVIEQLVEAIADLAIDQAIMRHAPIRRLWDMTDGPLMDADCIHGNVWYDCPTCWPPRRP